MPEQTDQGLRGLVPPNSPEAEISVLGAMLQDSAVVLPAMESLQPEERDSLQAAVMRDAPEVWDEKMNDYIGRYI
jgi:hypothetical protein